MPRKSTIDVIVEDNHRTRVGDTFVQEGLTYVVIRENQDGSIVSSRLPEDVAKYAAKE